MASFRCNLLWLCAPLLSLAYVVIWLLTALFSAAASFLGVRRSKAGIVHRRLGGKTSSGSGAATLEVPRLSRPLSDLRPSYDVVVIGSGYGGGVAASRMARASPEQTVCVLERGQERWPGEFPNTFWTLLKQVHVSGVFRLKGLMDVVVNFGNQTGLYHWIVRRRNDCHICHS